MDTAFVKGIGVLEALARSAEPRGVTDLAAELELTKSNVHRLLQTLIKLGYVRQAEGSTRYAATTRLWELGSIVVGRIDVREVARPHLVALAQRTQETVNLSMLDGAEVVYLDKIDSPQPVRAHSRVGGRAPAYCSSTGKAMMAFREDDLRDLSQRPLRRMSDKKALSAATLKRELEQICRDGYAFNKGDMTNSVWGVGAPIFGVTGQAVAGVGVAGPAERMQMRVLLKFAPAVVATAARISADLGFTGTRITK